MKRTVIVSVPYDLSKEERRSFHKDHPGYRLCFRQRYPNFPLVIAVISLVLVIASEFLHGMFR